MTQQPESTKKIRITRIALGLLVGLVVCVVVGWILILTLGNTPKYYFAGKSISAWRSQLSSSDPGASNSAVAMVNSRIIPQLTYELFSDTNDSRLRILLVDALNQLPGVQIFFSDADGRRIIAAQDLGELGPGAKSAIPALVQAVKGKDPVVRGPSILALGAIHGEAGTIVPLLIGCLQDDNLDAQAAKALGDYGVMAEVAVPKIVPLLHAPDKDTRAAAAEALQKIDPSAYSKAITGAKSSPTNVPPGQAGTQEVLRAN